MLRQWLIVAVCVLYSLPVHARRCENVSVWNSLSQFEPNLRNCTVIGGNLKILLIEKTTIQEYENISFPELTEITGFLLIYRVRGLTSLGKLFPNLTVIRGMTLITDYSLVLHDVSHLQEIGLHNLRYIARGLVRVERCPHLCYLNTVNWTMITNHSHSLHEYNRIEDDCKSCPGHCNGLCWNQDYCQDVETVNCHPECIGCAGPTAYDCYACRLYSDNGRCVSSCPKNKIRHSVLGICITEEECPTLLNGTWWIFQGQCVKSCPPRYEFYELDSKSPTCVHCGDDCTKVCLGQQIDSIASAQMLRGCTYINGSLLIKIHSKNIADELEETLGNIKEIDGFLKVYRSSSLTSLEFLKKLTIIHGMQLDNRKYALVVFENQNLHTLWNNLTLQIKRGGVFFHYNSHLCPSEIKRLTSATNIIPSSLDVSEYSNGDKTTCDYIELNITMPQLTAKSVTLEWEDFVVKSKKSSLIGYLLYYIEDPVGNMTVFDEQDECNINGWDSIFVSNNFQQILNLHPFTQYAYYIKTYISSSSENTSESRSGGQTYIQHFTTLSDNPSIPQNVKTVPSTNSIMLTWKSPEYPNGMLSHYVIIVEFQKDDSELLEQRDYCQRPYLQSHEFYHLSKSQFDKDANLNSTTNSTCCSKQEKIAFDEFDDFCSALDKTDMSTTNTESCNDYTFTISTDTPSEVNEIKINDTHSTKYVVESLRHFSMYLFLIKACNNESQCSHPVIVSNRTLPKDHADDIPPGLSVKVDDFDADVEWPEPQDPNSIVVSYHIEHKRIDVEHFKNVTQCITQGDYISFDKKYRMKNLASGKYYVRVKAVSLAGEGNFSKLIEFEVYPPSHGTSPVAFIIPIIVIILIIAGAFAYYHHHKRKHRLDHFLIADINPDYAGPIYVEDEWEMDRSDLDVSKELGQGTFGMVYNGFIKSQNRPCAVKTANAAMNVHERMEFLNEASVMKSFSDAHHVVKLLGVVSKGEPPLVVMELMERGDLKSFLRRSRDSSSSLTCAEMYRMAAEIADGMMYLAAKKFVHRDLAARNCMVAADRTVKIGDFGMTRDIYETDYYRKETRGLMPVRWMSPESLADGVFTTDSDVWSYGVVLWEMATLAEQPYQGLANEQVLQFVIAQGTLERPPECPDLLFEIMDACWKWRPNHRPLFKDIVEKLEPHIGQNFRLVSFYHSSDGEEYRMNAKDRVYNPPALTVPLNRNAAIHWNASDDDVSLYSNGSNRPTSLLSFQNQSKTTPTGDSYR